MSFSCRLEKGKHTVQIDTNFKTMSLLHTCINEAQAGQLAKKIAMHHMQGGWKLVMLNGKKVKQGKLVIPDRATISKIEKVGTVLPMGDGTVGEQQ